MERMNALADQSAKLRLLKEENSVILLEEEQQPDLVEKGERSLIGKLQTERRIGKNVLGPTMNKIWRISRSAEFVEARENTFILTFANQANKERVW